MSQQTRTSNSTGESFSHWCFQETVEIERKKRNLDEEKNSLERQRREFNRTKEFEEKRLKQQENLLNMKWHILEEELRKLADDREHVERQKQFYDRVAQYEREGRNNTSNSEGKVVKGELFFRGVRNELALKKRYRDLMKIYHPDNVDGDTGTIQEINREYQKLKKALL